MTKKYKLYKSGKALVIGTVAVVGVMATSTVSTVHADTTDKTSSVKEVSSADSTTDDSTMPTDNTGSSSSSDMPTDNTGSSSSSETPTDNTGSSSSSETPTDNTGSSSSSETPTDNTGSSSSSETPTDNTGSSSSSETPTDNTGSSSSSETSTNNNSDLPTNGKSDETVALNPDTPDVNNNGQLNQVAPIEVKQPESGQAPVVPSTVASVPSVARAVQQYNEALSQNGNDSSNDKVATAKKEVTKAVQKALPKTGVEQKKGSMIPVTIIAIVAVLLSVFGLKRIKNK